MKRFFHTLLPLMLILCLCLCACAEGGGTLTPAPDETPAADDASPVPDQTRAPSEFDIPEYKESVLYDPEIVDPDFNFGFDQSWLDTFGKGPDTVDALLRSAPTTAIRTTDWGTKYLMYDLDSGYRLFYFATTLYDGASESLCGFPVVVGRLLPHSAFSELAVGDPIEKAEAVDGVAALTEKYFVESSKMTPEGAAEIAELGRPCASFHYLSDGVLKIEYEMLKDRSLVISNIVYSANYRMTSVFKVASFAGTHSYTVENDYRIDPRDLPYQ